MDSNTLVNISAMGEYKIYYFHIWSRHRSMRNLDRDLTNLQATNATAYVTAHCDIQDCKECDKYPIIKMPFPFSKSKKWPQLAKKMWNWMIT